MDELLEQYKNGEKMEKLFRMQTEKWQGENYHFVFMELSNGKGLDHYMWSDVDRDWVREPEAAGIFIGFESSDVITEEEAMKYIKEDLKRYDERKANRQKSSSGKR